VLKRYCTFDEKPPHLQAKHTLRIHLKNNTMLLTDRKIFFVKIKKLLDFF
jgi:hypothetical protein